MARWRMAASPAGVLAGCLDLCRDELDHAVEEVVLVGHVVVEGHRLDLQLAGEPAWSAQSIPSASAMDTAARRTRSRLSGVRRCFVAGRAIPGQLLDACRDAG
jgi:hypothetical protein